MSDWFETLEGIWEQSWSLLEAAARDAGSAAHTGALASRGLGGGGEARMVVLRGADRRAARLEIHTDRASRKAQEIAADPLVTLLFWVPDRSLQIRARARATLLTDDTQATWETLSESARRNYGGQPPPSTPLASAEDHAKTAERDRFAILSARLTSLDALHLGSRHRRAIYERERDFAGMWLAP